MKDMELDQYFGITVITTCRLGSSTIVEDKYVGPYGDIQVTETGDKA